MPSYDREVVIELIHTLRTQQLTPDKETLIIKYISESLLSPISVEWNVLPNLSIPKEKE